MSAKSGFVDKYIVENTQTGVQIHTANRTGSSIVHQIMLVKSKHLCVHKE